MKQSVFYVGPFVFPDGGAEARRVTGISHSLFSAGYEITIGCGRKSSSIFALQQPSPFSVLDLGERPAASSNKFLKLWKALTCGGNTTNWIKKSEPKPDAIFLYGGRTGYLFHLIPWCRHNHIPLIVDVVEWYDARHVLGGPLGPFHLSSELAMRYLHVKAKNLIVISRFLERYYQNQGCRTIRIPPTLDVQGLSARVDANNGSAPLTLAYAGVPGKKDLLNNVVEALLRVDPEGKEVQLVVAGPKPEDLLRFPSLQRRRYTSLPGCVKALGQMTHEKVLDVIREADFTVLLRPHLRYAEAGFPTKVPESLALGTPVICNITSDLGEHIHDGQEGIICEDHSVESFLTALKRAMELAPDGKKAMRLAARKEAERSFDFRNYSESLNTFIQEAIAACH
jgi:glycosyltransferase involved in cell wall biosynthesis